MIDDELDQLFRETMELLVEAEKHIAEAERLLAGRPSNNIIQFPVHWRLVD